MICTARPTYGPTTLLSLCVCVCVRVHGCLYVQVCNCSFVRAARCITAWGCGHGQEQDRKLMGPISATEAANAAEPHKPPSPSTSHTPIVDALNIPSHHVSAQQGLSFTVLRLRYAVLHVLVQTETPAFRSCNAGL